MFISSLIKRINKSINGKAIDGDELDNLVSMNLNSVDLSEKSKTETNKSTDNKPTSKTVADTTDAAESESLILTSDPIVEKPKPSTKEKPESVILVDKKQIRSEYLISTAKRYLHVKEEGGQNKGKMVEAFQKSVDGKASGEPWCLCFVWHCILETEKKYFERFNETILSKMFKTEHVLTMWNLSPKEYRSEIPVFGSLVIWQHLDSKGNGTARGHIGIVSNVLDKTYIETIEGNTKNDTVVEDEGDGVYLLKRNYKAPTGSKRIVGYLLPWG
jgi:hypothetical protein